MGLASGSEISNDWFNSFMDLYLSQKDDTSAFSSRAGIFDILFMTDK